MTDRTPEYEREALNLLIDLFGPGVDAPPVRVRRFAEMLAQRDQEHARELAEARFAPLGDNHHNALACPYCNPGHKLESASALLDGLLQKAKDWKLLFFYIANLSANAWRDPKNAEALFRRINGYAMEGEVALRSYIEKVERERAATSEGKG